MNLNASTTDFLSLFSGSIPILSAPMSGVSTPEMVAATSHVGGLGVLAGDLLSPEELQLQIQTVKQLTDRPFAVNLRAREKPNAQVDANAHEQAKAFADAMSLLAQDLGLCEQYEWAQLPELGEQLDVILAEDVPIVTVSFGGLREIYAEALEAKGVLMMGCATTLREAKVQRAAGVSAIIAQGVEAGGPRLNFEQSDERSQVGLMSLIAPMVRATGLPIVAAGGIATAQQIRAAMTLGAAGVMVGSALLRSSESALPTIFKDFLPMTADTDTILTSVFSGRMTRVYPTEIVDVVEDAKLTIPRYPEQWQVMAPLLEAARRQGRSDLLEICLGQSACLARNLPTRMIVQQLWSQVCE